VFASPWKASLWNCHIQREWSHNAAMNLGPHFCARKSSFFDRKCAVANCFHLWDMRPLRRLVHLIMFSVGDSCLGLLIFEKVTVGSLILLDQWESDVVPFQ
jgi:hypothetical protein